MRYKSNHSEALVLPHHGHQNHRLDEVLAERNYRMVGTGQEMWAHTCNRCTKLYQGDDGNWCMSVLHTSLPCLTSVLDRMSAGVHDGVTVRHVACSVHDCTIALESQRDLFCPTHQHLIQDCCITGCASLAEPGFRTCNEPTHRRFQEDAEEQNSAMFQLHSRLRNSQVSQVPKAGSLTASTAAEPSTVPPLGSTSQPGSEPGSEPHLKGRLYRNWTHNEQLFVRCCGVIISRATFFGSEGVSGVNVSSSGPYSGSY